MAKPPKKQPPKKLRKLAPNEYYDPQSKTVKDARTDPPPSPHGKGGHHSYE